MTATDKVTLIYQHQNRGGPWHPMEYPVWLDWTDCTLGGRRAWFLCPAAGCGWRVAQLYVGASGIFACRHCNRLAYASQRENADDRAARRAERIRRRLKWELGILNGKDWKPKRDALVYLQTANPRAQCYSRCSAGGDSAADWSFQTAGERFPQRVNLFRKTGQANKSGGIFGGIQKTINRLNIEPGGLQRIIR